MVPSESVRAQLFPGELKNLSQGREKETLRELPLVHGGSRATLLPQFVTFKKKKKDLFIFLCAGSLLLRGLSLVVEQALEHRLNSCGTQA